MTWHAVHENDQRHRCARSHRVCAKLKDGIWREPLPVYSSHLTKLQRARSRPPDARSAPESRFHAPRLESSCQDIGRPTLEYRDWQGGDDRSTAFAISRALTIPASTLVPRTIAMSYLIRRHSEILSASQGMPINGGPQPIYLQNIKHSEAGQPEFDPSQKFADAPWPNPSWESISNRCGAGLAPS